MSNNAEVAAPVLHLVRCTWAGEAKVIMFCVCCRPPGGFFAEGVAEPVVDFARALKRRNAYERRRSYSRAAPAHPEQTEFVVRGAQVLTMDPHLGNFSCTDIHVREGVIVNIGRNLQAESAIEIDGSGLAAVPGFVEDHQHPLSALLALADPHQENFENADPADIYRAMRLALVTLGSAGITSVHVCGADLGADLAETAILAQIDTGGRGRFSVAVTLGAPANKSRLRELHDTWFVEPVEHLLELGLSGAERHLADVFAPHRLPPTVPLPADTTVSRTLAERTIGAAKRLGLDQWIGSLAPGKRADIILVAGDPEDKLAPQDIPLVVIDGRIKKRNGVLVEPNEGLIKHEGEEALMRLRQLPRSKVH